MLVGSVAKGTYVGSPDIDLFILFPPETERSDLERLGLQIGHEVLGGEKRYAEHPYTHGSFQGFEVDLVPCYKLEDASKLRSAVDRTPFHTRYVLSQLKKDQRDQVLLLKQFMKGVGVYGAEAKVQGFSGYLTELLILSHGDFANVVKEGANWRPGTRMDVDGHLKGNGDGALGFADPVDLKRNVASALSLDKFALFVHACREYLRDPNQRFFFPRERPMLELEDVKGCFASRGTSPLVVSLDRPELVDDNLYPQIQRSLLGLRKLLESQDFKVLDHTYTVGKDVRLAFELESDMLPLSKLHQGPPAWTANADEFVDKWKDGPLGHPFLSEGRWLVFVQREFRDPAKFLELKGGEAALGNDFREMRGMRCRAGDKTYLAGNRALFTKLLDKRENWRV
jgi:tRNA nucleotidyltransferase (CCA-adding enzyme)